MPLNCLIFHDDIAKTNRTLEDARKGAKELGRMLKSNRIKANVPECLKKAGKNPIKWEITS